MCRRHFGPGPKMSPGLVCSAGFHPCTCMTVVVHDERAAHVGDIMGPGPKCRLRALRETFGQATHAGVSAGRRSRLPVRHVVDGTLD